MDPLLGVGLATVVVVMFLSIAFSLDRCSPVSTQRDEALGSVHECIEESLRNLPAVYTRSQKGAEQERVAVEEERFAQLYFGTTRCSMAIKAWMVPITIGMVVFVLYRCRWLTANGRMSVGRFVSVFLVVLYLLSSLTRMVSSVKAMVFHWGIVQASADIFTHCDPPPPAATLSVASVPPHGYGCVDVRYAGILNGVNLHVERGERVAIVGTIGSGKSTLLRVLVRLIQPDSGDAYMHGAPYSALDNAEVRRAIGYVPQSPTLFNRSLLENVRYGNEDVDEADVWALAERLGVSEALRAASDRGATVGKGGGNLSGGQRQLVWVLRVLLGGPEVVLLDEPTAALDPRSRELLAQVMRSVETVVFVTHDEQLVHAVATRVVYMDGGVVVKDERV
jgi:ABC-type multidrug transport system fused ATPase/permease subunit